MREEGREGGRGGEGRGGRVNVIIILQAGSCTTNKAPDMS